MFRSRVTALAHRLHSDTARQAASHRVHDPERGATFVKIEIVIDVLVLLKVGIETRLNIIVDVVLDASNFVRFNCAVVKHTHQRFELVDVVAMLLEVGAELFDAAGVFRRHVFRLFTRHGHRFEFALELVQLEVEGVDAAG